MSMTLGGELAPPIRGRRSAGRRPAQNAAMAQYTIPMCVAALGIVLSLLSSEWIAGAGIAVLWLIWALLSEDGYSPVLPLAVTFQWIQVTCGIYYFAFTGRELEAHYASDYRTMVLLGLGCVSALTLGLAAGLRLARANPRAGRSRDGFTVRWKTLLLAYIIASFGSAMLREIAWSVPGLSQAIVAVGFVRLGVLFLIFRRLVTQHFRWDWFFGFLALELMLGFTGYFAGFREPLMLAAVALLEVFRSRSLVHWFRMVALVALMGATGLVWMGIRSVYRSEINTGELGESRVERLGRVGELSSEWLSNESTSVAEDLDRLVERLWAIYYPALAVARVPELLPHEDGAILLAAVTHIVTPRALFPDKQALVSDSDMVRKYSGVYVAGAEEGTSIAFGYAAESYIDFGLPWMFVPSLVFGVIMGVAYRGVFRWICHRELAVGLACVVFWLSLYLFERSWAMTLGLSFTVMIVVGGLTLVLDRALLRRSANARYRAHVRHRAAAG